VDACHVLNPSSFALTRWWYMLARIFAVQEREDGANENADADDNDHEGEAVRAA
jgi:hypothetical protein